MTRNEIDTSNEESTEGRNFRFFGQMDERKASLSLEEQSLVQKKITISVRIGLPNGSQKSINEADKVVATTLRLLTCLSTLERLLIFQFNRRYFSIIILGKDNP